MKRVLSTLLIAIAFSLTAAAQPARPAPITYELACPAGYSPVANGGKSFDVLTGKWRANLCISDKGDGTMVCQMSGCGAASSAFSAITGGTNSTATMHVGTGASLDATGTGSLIGTGLSSAVTQGTDTKYLTSGTIAGSGLTLCSDPLLGASTSSCTSPLVSGLVQSGLMAEYRFNEGTGTTLTDYTGNGNTATFCASAPVWDANNPNNGGLRFDGTSNCINLPSGLNSARTIFLITQFIPPNSAQFTTPICGSANPQNWGAMFQGAQLGSQAGAQGGEYYLAGWTQAVGFPIQTQQLAHGTQLIAWTLGSASDSTHDQIWVNSSIPPYGPDEPSLPNTSFNNTGQSAGSQSAGHFVLGGTALGGCINAFSTWWQGVMFEAVFYSTFLTPAQIGQNFEVLQTSLAQRGVPLSVTNSHELFPAANTNNQFVAVGDSITYGAPNTTAYPQFIGFNNSSASWNWANLGQSGYTALQFSTVEANSNRVSTAVYPSAGNNALIVWYGANDCHGGSTGVQTYGSVVAALRNAKAHLTGTSQKVILASMVSYTGEDTCKNVLDTLERQQWPTFADGFADMAADPNLGADGASTSTTYFVDGVHPTTNGQANDVAPIAQRAIRRAFGNTSWTAANTYTTAAAAATATTAGSEATNTVTITFGATPANCLVGSMLTVAGTTPAGYSGNWQILTRTGTQVTYFNPTTGLGAITVQGTGVCPQQVDEDVYVILGGSATTPNFTLETCVGYTGQNIYLKHANTTSPWTVTPFGSETIDGAASLTMPTATSGNLPVVILQSTLVSSAAGGCNWSRLQ
jgi:hypothetical protein